MIGVAIPLHRQTEQAQELKASLDGQSVPFQLFDEPKVGSHAANVNRALKWARDSHLETLVVLDHDVVVLDPRFLEKLDAHLSDDPRIGVLGCVSLWYPPWEYRRAMEKFLQPRTQQPWIPGYCHAYRMERTRSLQWDESCPYPKGMTDMDVCYQMRDWGYQIWCATNTAVRHPGKPPGHEEYKPEEVAQMNRWICGKWGKKMVDMFSAPPNCDIKKYEVRGNKVEVDYTETKR